ncbi:MAG: hypothetical protein ACUVQY_10720 [Thermoproteota archaeon]
MGVRVKVKVVVGGKTAETVVLVNSGFETDRPQLLVPYDFLSLNNIGLDMLGKPTAVEYDTAGGPITMYTYPRVCAVTVVEEDRVSKSVKADLVLSPVEKEALMSDALIEELEIIILSPRKGLWKFSDDPPSKVRQSHEKNAGLLF